MDFSHIARCEKCGASLATFVPVAGLSVVSTTVFRCIGSSRASSTSLFSLANRPGKLGGSDGAMGLAD